VCVVSTSTSGEFGFDKNVALLHDWLKLVEQKVKGLNVSVGDDDDMSSCQQKQAVSCCCVFVYTTPCRRLNGFSQVFHDSQEFFEN